MYVSIDLENMRIAYLHTDSELLHNISWISMRDDGYHIFELEANDGNSFQRFTDLELSLLYKSLFAIEWQFSRAKRKALIQVLTEHCLNMEPTKADLEESRFQCDYINGKPDRDWVYVYGAKRPTERFGLFTEHATTKLNDNGQNQALQGYTPAVSAKKAASVSTAAHITHESTATSSNTTVKAKRPAKGITAAIRAAAQLAWETAGSPSDKAEIITIKKQDRDKFIEEGINKNTLSVQLSKWQKAVMGTST